MKSSTILVFIVLVWTCSASEEETDVTEDVVAEDVSKVNGSEYSYQVSLHLSYNQQFLCAGSIISSSMVLTAAHCMFYSWGGQLPPLIVNVLTARDNLSDTSGEAFAVQNVKLHPDYNRTTMENDLALVEINSVFPTNTLVRKVSLEKTVPDTQGSYNRCTVTGWDQNQELQVLEVMIVKCDDYHSSFPGRICTNVQTDDGGICITDGGNPLICDEKLTGVLALEPDCNDSMQRSVFESTGNAIYWLNKYGLSSANTTNLGSSGNPFFLYICLFILTILNNLF